MRANRAVSPVISVILMVAIVVILVATASVFIFDSGESLNQPPPFVADTTGEFEAGSGSDKQNVRITHRGGDSVDVGEIEIIIRASGPGSELPTEARLVDLPAGVSSGFPDENNIDGNTDLISRSNQVNNQIWTEDDSNTWEAGDTIRFRIATGEADFREGESPAADTLEVIIVHTPSDVIISENTFTP